MYPRRDIRNQYDPVNVYICKHFFGRFAVSSQNAFLSDWLRLCIFSILNLRNAFLNCSYRLTVTPRIAYWLLLLRCLACLLANELPSCSRLISFRVSLITTRWLLPNVSLDLASAATLRILSLIPLSLQTAMIPRTATRKKSYFLFKKYTL